MTYRAFVKCDWPRGIARYVIGLRCEAVAIGEGPSREIAATNALANARANGWAIAPDRLLSHDDRCPAHKETKP